MDGNRGTNQPHPDCRAALTALVEGRLDEWRGLGECTRADAEAALGSSGDARGRSEMWGLQRLYPGGPRTPGGVEVWFQDERVAALRVISPRLVQPILTLLHEPEGKAASGLSSEWEQWIYASRGLAAHVRPWNGEVVTLYAFPPTTVEKFLDSEIARVRVEEFLIER